MNPKFFDVKKEKQDAIINAALVVFAENGYRKASTDVIVKEAGISKGLLFHYFISKKGLYEFIYDYSVKYMMLELTQSVKQNETDFFEIQRMIELAKTRVMKNYPYMQQFLSNVKFETHSDALGIINETGDVIDEAYKNIYKKADMTKFYSQIDVSKIIQMIGWMSDGFIKDKFREGTPDLDEMNEEFTQYLSMMREHFYTGTGFGLSADGDDSVAGRDDSVMESMRNTVGNSVASKYVPELSFEERLAAGKKSAYALPEEDKVEEPEGEATVDSDEAINDTDTEATEGDVALVDEAIASQENNDDISTEEATVTEELDSSDSEASDGEKSDAEEVVEDDKVSEEVVISTASIDETTNEEESVEEVVIDEGAAEEEATEEEVLEDEAPTADTEVDNNSQSEINDIKEDNDDIEVSEVSVELDKDDSTEEIVPESELAASVGELLTSSDKEEPAVTSDFRELVMPVGYDDNYEVYDSIESAMAGSNNGPVISTSFGIDDSFILDDLSEKIINSTMTAEDERAKELESMGPAPVLPEFDPESIKRKESTIDDVVEEEAPSYFPLRF